MEMTREEWLEKRKEFLTASDCAAVLGANPWHGPLGVYASKVLDDRTPDNSAMRWGRRLENVIGEAYEEETGRPVHNPGDTVLTVHPDIPWLAATLDRTTESTSDTPGPADGPGVLELKSVGGRYTTPSEWSEEPPLHYQVQVQIQAECRNTKWGSLAGLFPGYKLAWTDLLRDRDFFTAAYPVLDNFWHNNVLAKNPPEDKGSLDVIKRVWPRETGKTITLDHAALALAEKWNKLKGDKKNLDGKIKEIEGELRLILKDAAIGILPDGTKLTLKTTSVKGYTKTVEPYKFRTLRRAK